MDPLCGFSVSSGKGNNFCEFLFAFLYTDLFLKGVCSKRRIGTFHPKIIKSKILEVVYFIEESSHSFVSQPRNTVNTKERKKNIEKVNSRVNLHLQFSTCWNIGNESVLTMQILIKLHSNLRAF